VSDVPSLNQIRQACSGCSLRQLCLPYGVAENDLDQLEQIVSRRKPVAAGHALFHQGEKLGALYAVRSGSVKTHALSRDGNEQITGFHFPGELVGLDALSADVHGCTATTLETTTLCAIPFDRLDELAGGNATQPPEPAENTDRPGEFATPPETLAEGLRKVDEILQQRIQEAILEGALQQADDAVPPEYLDMVEEYYRTLSADVE